MAITTLGRELVRRKLPDKYKHYADSPLDKGTVTRLMTEIAKDDPDGYVDVLQDLNNIGQAVVSAYGRDAALPFADMKIDAETRHLNDQLRAVVDKVLDDPNMTPAQKEQRIIELGYKYTQRVEDAVFKSNDRRNTAYASQIKSGTRGSKTQLMQLQFGNMLMKDALNRDIPYIMMDSYTKGATPMSYWVSSSSGRKGLYDVQAATGQAGYLGKQVTAATHDTIISEEDCGTQDTGVPFPADSTQNVGAVLLRPFHNHPAGSVVTEEMVAEAEEGEQMLLRSPMTCRSRIGVCAHCNGLTENGKFPGIGEYVSLSAARTFVEPITQAGISCLHPDTEVRMADWSVKAIKDIQVGDMVIGVDLNGHGRPVKVTRTYMHGLMPMQLYVYGKNTEETVSLVCTSEHKLLQRIDGKQLELPAGANEGYADIVPVQSLEGLPEEAVAFPGQKWLEFSVSDMGMIPAYDIEVDHPDHLFLLANGLVVANSKHSGGVGGKRVTDPDGEDQPTGFKNIERMFMAPTNFPGGAVLAPMDGTVSAIRRAPQGGTYVTVGTSTVYCSPDRTMSVKEGDKVYAGDVLTNGVPNPAEVTSLKGLGAGRLYFNGKLGDILKQMNAGTDRRNLEAFTRSMVSRVRITSEDGYKDWLPGDLVDYNVIAADYEPRESAVTEPVDKAVNKYLEKPVLYYSIGTRITPSIAAELKKYGFNDVTASSEELPFKPQFLRPTAVLQSNSNWLPRLAGERLRDSMFDAARKGITDSYDAPSYVDRLVAAPYKP